MKRNLLIKKMCLIAMFSAIAYVLTFIAHNLHLSIFPSLPFLTYDPKDIMICIGGFVLGPIAAIAMSVVVSLIEMVTISSTGIYGLIMNIVSTCSFVVPAALIYKYNKSFKGALLSLVVGFVANIVVMTLWNIIITPIYMDIPREILVSKYLLFIVLFNMIKVGINISLILILYKPVVNVLRITHLVEKNDSKSNLKVTLTMLAIGGVLLTILIIVWILIKRFA